MMLAVNRHWDWAISRPSGSSGSSALRIGIVCLDRDRYGRPYVVSMRLRARYIRAAIRCQNATGSSQIYFWSYTGVHTLSTCGWALSDNYRPYTGVHTLIVNMRLGALRYTIGPILASIRCQHASGRSQIYFRPYTGVHTLSTCVWALSYTGVHTLSTCGWALSYTGVHTLSTCGWALSHTGVLRSQHVPGRCHIPVWDSAQAQDDNVWTPEKNKLHQLILLWLFRFRWRHASPLNGDKNCCRDILLIWLIVYSLITFISNEIDMEM